MQPQTWSRYVTRFIILVMISIAIINYMVNPYNLFKPTINTHYNRLKNNIASEYMTYVYEMNHIKPKTLMVGSSRIGYFKSNTLKSYAPSPIFNLTLAGSSIYEQRRYIEYAINHYPIKTIVWSLDFFSFNPIKHPNPHFSEERLTHHFYLNDYLFSLLSYQTLMKSIKTYQFNRSFIPYDSNTSPYYEQYHYKDVQGQTLSRKEIRLNANWTLNEYGHNREFLGAEEFKIPRSIDPKVAEVAAILTLCKKHNITCILYTSPVYREHLDMIYAIELGESYEYWKQSLAQLTDYWDFSTYNERSENIMNFRDSSHITSDNGKDIFIKLFHKRVEKGSNFGFYVTKANIADHIKDQRHFIQPFQFSSEFPPSLQPLH